VKLLFVCVKNSSRSQMAEALVKLSRGNGFQAFSAGVAPGECVHPHAVEVMQELGYDLSGHECKHVSAFNKHFSTLSPRWTSRISATR
jgi:arsenate reductase (thioredoxin)